MPDVGESTRVRAYAGRAVGFAKARPRAQKATAGALLLALATAPFGGLESVSAEAPVAHLEVGAPIQVGPFKVTIRKVVTVPDLTPTLTPADGNTLFAIVAMVENTHDRPEHYLTLTDALHVGDDAVITASEGRPVRPRVFDFADSTSITEINPGITHELVIAWEQSGPLAHAKEVPLTIDELTWLEKDVLLGIDDQRWRDFDEPAFHAVLPVEARS